MSVKLTVATLSLIVLLLGQLLTGVVWASRLDSRLASVERYGPIVDDLSREQSAQRAQLAFLVPWAQATDRKLRRERNR